MEIAAWKEIVLYPLTTLIANLGCARRRITFLPFLPLRLLYHIGAPYTYRAIDLTTPTGFISRSVDIRQQTFSKIGHPFDLRRHAGEMPPKIQPTIQSNSEILHLVLNLHCLPVRRQRQLWFPLTSAFEEANHPDLPVSHFQSELVDPGLCPESALLTRLTSDQQHVISIADELSAPW